MAEEIDLYLRKSKVVREREARDLLCVQAQEDRGRRWADDHGYTVRRVWVDNLLAWSDIKRPEFDKALSALRADDVPALWCYAMDRWSRKGAGDVVPILDAGKRLIFDYERLDSAEPRDRRRIIDSAEQAREYSDRLSYNVRDTKATQRNAGKWLGRAPHGLDVDPKTRKLKPGQADLWATVLRLFETIADGKSGRATAREMNAADTWASRPARGGQWSVSSIHRIIYNPAYQGWQVTNRKGVPGHAVEYRDANGDRVSVVAEGVELVSQDLADRARRALAGHVMPIRGQGAKQGTARHLLTDLAECGGCGGATPSTGRNHVCSWHTQGKLCPAPVSVSRLPLEEFVTRMWLARLTTADPENPDDLELLAVVAQRWAAHQHPEETRELDEARGALKAARRRTDPEAVARRAAPALVDDLLWWLAELDHARGSCDCSGGPPQHSDD